MSGDLGVITTYFNPSGYRSKLSNFERFASQPALEGVPLAVVEADLGGAVAPLDPRWNSVTVRGGDVMWQKERLLNLALARLPPSCTKVAWLDCDVLFEDAGWAAQASALLERCAVIQPFTSVVRLPRGHLRFEGEGDRWPSFAAVVSQRPQELLRGDFAAHGHTGFAWAARRSLLETHGLYDACITGSGDHMMAHAFSGDWDSPCVQRIFAGNRAHLRHFVAWARRVYAEVGARVGATGGQLLHLWHGEMHNRRYVDRNRELAAFRFDPARDIRVSPSGPWEWAAADSRLRRWARDYFDGRKEDEALT